MTVLLGPVPCHGCRVPVSVVRRPVRIPVSVMEPDRGWCRKVVNSKVMSETLVLQNGRRHKCAA